MQRPLKTAQKILPLILVSLMGLCGTTCFAQSNADEALWLDKVQTGFHDRMDNHQNVLAAMSEDAVNISSKGLKEALSMLSGSRKDKKKTNDDLGKVRFSADVDRDVFHLNVGIRF